MQALIMIHAGKKIFMTIYLLTYFIGFPRIYNFYPLLQKQVFNGCAATNVKKIEYDMISFAQI